MLVYDIEPFFNWRHLYIAEEDEKSPFYGREYSEIEFTHAIYNFVIHPQWDHFGSETMYIKILFVDYDEGYCFLEMIGEWNDAVTNDMMMLKRDILDEMLLLKVNKFIVIGENVLNFHASDDSYYEELFEDVGEKGWTIFLNFRSHVLTEFRNNNIDYFFHSGGELDDFNWRRFSPGQVFGNLSRIIKKRLNAS